MSLKSNLVCYGTRPEEIKLYPFTHYKNFTFLEVDQSPDLHQGLIKAEYAVRERNLEPAIKDLLPKRVIVQGDTRTAFRAAVFAFENKIPVVHVEAGMRTWDLTQPFPEEGYRQMIDCIAADKFCSTEEAAKNCNGVYVGQTSIDTLMEFVGSEVKDRGYTIVTLHRSENLGRIAEMKERIGSDKDLWVFAHPNAVGRELKKHFPKVIPPLPYKQFVKLLAGCHLVATDSGGLVEEAVALGKSVIQLRDKTERGHGETYAPGATKKIVEALNEE